MIVRPLLIASVLALAASGIAAAHVRVAPATVAAGSTATLTFRCPNERASTSTVKLEVQLPPDVPLVSVAAVPGWQSSVTDHTITWQGGTIDPGAVGHFPIVAGPIPAGHPLIFKAVQTYGNGEVVRWIQERAPGEAEPPFPAPVVDVH
jgi:uncharacterized protein YcnI